MIVAMLVAAAAPTDVGAEREFARRAQTDGMWTAFRATAAEDAIMFLPQATRAHDFLKERKDPLLGYMWWPASAYMSCDGRAGATTGPSVLGASRGYFTTIWVKQPSNEWKWILDHGDTLAKARPSAERTTVRRASCAKAPGPKAMVVRSGGGGGFSDDGTLGWTWNVDAAGGRRVTVHLWNGGGYDPVIEDRVSPPTP